MLGNDDPAEQQTFVQGPEDNLAQVEKRWGLFKEAAAPYASSTTTEFETNFERDSALWKDASQIAILQLTSANEASGRRQVEGDSLTHFNTARDPIDPHTQVIELLADKTKASAFATEKMASQPS